MNKEIFLCVYLIVNTVLCDEYDIFHVKSKITFHSDSVSNYFGYSIVLRDSSLLVGAPKAVNDKNVTQGLVYNCKLNDLTQNNVICIDYNKASNRTLTTLDEKLETKVDMWFGATIAVTPENKFVICAPRWEEPYFKHNNNAINLGTCFFDDGYRKIDLAPLGDKSHAYNPHKRLYYFAYGLSGMSLKVTENNRILIGAPGLSTLTGGFIDFKYSSKPKSLFTEKQPILDSSDTFMSSDVYFGYSIESGKFQVNGSILYVAGAPRGNDGYGQVLIFDPPQKEKQRLDIRAELRGPILGSYFGASLCCTDLNGDGRSDLLVGALNFISNSNEMPYDEGAVFVYLANKEIPYPPRYNRGILIEAGYVTGLKKSGARFGTAIAALGDINNDGYGDVAIGAPWEDYGKGAVYIYSGSDKGLRSEYSQRIVAEGAKSFGISISRGVDVDGNHCNDVAIGAYASATAYLYRCLQTMEVTASIKVPSAMNLPKDTKNFTAHFCVNVKLPEFWRHAKIDLKASITDDPIENRTTIGGDSDYTVHVKSSSKLCEERNVKLGNKSADLSKPILLEFDVKLLIDDSPTFRPDAVRLSENSTLHATFLIQLVKHCGEDLICTPLLTMTLDAYDDKYIPGTNSTLGAKLTVFNKEEPAYAAKVYISLPLTPKRVPGACALEKLNMICEVPSPLENGESVTWDIELEYDLKIVEEKVLEIKAELKHPVYSSNTNVNPVKDVKITVLPMASFNASGKMLPNATITVPRDKYDKGENVTFVHYFEITNYGPSDWPKLKATIAIPENVTLSNTVKGCIYSKSNLTCAWELAARQSVSVSLSFKYDLAKYGQILEQNIVINETTTLLLLSGEKHEISLTTQVVLAPSEPIWPAILGSVVGLLLLAAIVFALYKYGFFSRRDRDIMKILQEEGSESEEPGCSTDPTTDRSTLDLLSEDSDEEDL